METNLLIAGIPATEWIGRRARFWGHESKQHPTPCLIMGLENTKVIIKPIGHKKTEMVDADKIAPTWKNNDDLRQKYAPQLVGRVVADPTDVKVNAVSAHSEFENAVLEFCEVTNPVAETSMASTLDKVDSTVERPKSERAVGMIIHNQSVDWIPTYSLYLEALKAEAGDRAMLEEVHQAIAAHVARQAQLVDDLATFGVQIIYTDELERGESPASPPSVIENSPTGSRRGKIGMDKFIIDWGAKIKNQLAAGGHVVGTVGCWSDEIGVSWLALSKRLGLIESVLNVKFEDTKGRKGSDCRGRITASLR